MIRVIRKNTAYTAVSFLIYKVNEAHSSIK